MFKKIIAAALLIILLTVAIVQAMDHKDEKVSNDNLGGLRTGVKAPDFELKSLDGKQTKLSDYKGKKILLNFWATWCPPCKEEMPAMEEFNKKAGSDVVILAVNIDPENDVKAFADNMGVTFPILLDSQQSKNPVNELYQVMSIPTSYFIDRNGVIADKFIGGMTLKHMETTMNSIN
ncbi:peroxiredoxin family protein [Peribacillus glennii]|uniref:TlpA family protein disulfide reductase n=1 Tax=Peribacillus glennii TaxID=2303991 RepID=A0A372L6X4_9BACI|nr:TlpA disulfide reductase family protein [Peribacillus glennii]RFU60546.1 TlpA family protein disulfide reductase [Peribacillus glennii]